MKTTASIEMDLIRRAKDGDISARDALLDAFDPLLWKLSFETIATSYDPDDLHNEAVLIFYKSLEVFDPERGNRLMTFTYHCVRRGLRRIAQSSCLVRIPPTTHQKFDAPKRWTLTSLDACRPGDIPLRHVLASDIHTQEARSIEDREELHMLHSAINALPDRLRDVVQRRLQQQTLEQIAHQYGVSRERIRQLEERAHNQLWVAINKLP